MKINFKNLPCYFFNNFNYYFTNISKFLLKSGFLFRGFLSFGKKLAARQKIIFIPTFSL